MAEKMRENTFDFNDFIDQLDGAKYEEPMGLAQDDSRYGQQSSPSKNMKVYERQIARKCDCVFDMTPRTWENPDLLNPRSPCRICWFWKYIRRSQ